MYRYLILCTFWQVFNGVNCIRNDDEEEKGRKYQFEYAVEDTKSGNIHSREETGLGGSLSGKYSAHYPDGFKRTVLYKVDGDSGFIATVHKERIHNCYHCLEATPFSVGYEIQHHGPDSYVRSFFYMGSGTAASQVKVNSYGARIHTKIKHPPPLIHLN